MRNCRHSERGNKVTDAKNPDFRSFASLRMTLGQGLMNKRVQSAKRSQVGAGSKPALVKAIGKKQKRVA